MAEPDGTAVDGAGTAAEVAGSALVGSGLADGVAAGVDGVALGVGDVVAGAVGVGVAEGAWLGFVEVTGLGLAVLLFFGCGEDEDGDGVARTLVGDGAGVLCTTVGVGDAEGGSV